MINVILITGTPGSGKTTIANKLARRLKTYQVIGTDTIREILRSYVDKAVNPVLHAPGIVATKYAPKGASKAVWSYQIQSMAIKAGVEGAVRRAVKEGNNLIIEGVHLIPGMADLRDIKIRGIKVVRFVLNVKNRDEHMRRLIAQGEERSASKIAHFNLVRQFQTFLLQEAKANNTTIVSNRSIEGTIRRIVDEIKKSTEL